MTYPLEFKIVRAQTGDIKLAQVHADLSPEEISDLLFEMGEEFRHLFYHIKDARIGASQMWLTAS